MATLLAHGPSKGFWDALGDGLFFFVILAGVALVVWANRSRCEDDDPDMDEVD